jgi:hypothetical protein
MIQYQRSMAVIERARAETSSRDRAAVPHLTRSAAPRALPGVSPVGRENGTPPRFCAFLARPPPLPSWAVRYALVLALASCGRLGFSETNSPTGDSGAGSEAMSGTVRVVVVTDETLPGVVPATKAGLPVDSATVLVDRGTGTLERLLTDAQGSVTLATDGLVAYHVVYGSGSAWRVYTVATGATGTVSLGGNASSADGQMTIVLPNGPGNTFAANLPEHCQSIFNVSSTPSLSIPYNGPCEGQVVRVIGFASTNLSNERYVDAGMVKIARGTQVMVSGSYATPPTYAIQLTNLPAGAQFVTAEVLARSQLDLTPMESSSTSGQTPVTGPTMTVTTTAAAGANTLRVTADNGRAGRAFISTSEQIAPVSFSAPPISARFDAKALLPAFTSFDFDAKLNLTWAGGTGGTMIVVELLTDSFEWDAYLPPTATSLALPVIPADIGFPRSPTVYDVTLRRLDIPGATAVGLTPAIDKTWRRWPHDAALLPASGNRMAEARYVSGLVTGPSAATRPDR